jgi:glycosyltransferase involved in cell wall biosynthesis
VDLASDFKEWGMDDIFGKLGCGSYQIDFSRSPLSLDNVKAYGQLKKVIANGNYDIVHCHTPNASVITRLVCRKLRKKTGLKVFYTAHGFHFYKGAPKLNWMVFYPIEKFCSRFTDKLITINKEDYELAKAKFHAKAVHYVPGVGIDLSRFENIQVDRAAKRREIGVPEDAFLLLSVGELSKRKNHKLVLQALAKIDDPNIHYVIVGKGALQEELQQFAREHQQSDRFHLLGYRRDIAELYKSADLCCFPSLHEGLPVALMEAMACRLSVACSRIRGNTDLIDETGGSLFDANDPEECRQAIIRVLNGEREAMGVVNQNRVQSFSHKKILATMKSVYES